MLHSPAACLVSKTVVRYRTPRCVFGKFGSIATQHFRVLHIFCFEHFCAECSFSVLAACCTVDLSAPDSYSSKRLILIYFVILRKVVQSHVMDCENQAYLFFINMNCSRASSNRFISLIGATVSTMQFSFFTVSSTWLHRKLSGPRYEVCSYSAMISTSWRRRRLFLRQPLPTTNNLPTVYIIFLFENFAFQPFSECSQEPRLSYLSRLIITSLSWWAEKLSKHPDRILKLGKTLEN